MEIDEIINEFKNYTGKLPKKALEEAINKKEEIIPELLKSLEYTVNNLNKICDGEDNYFGYTFAIFLLAEFKVKEAFPYYISLLNNDVETVEIIFGDDFTEFLSRILASTYNGDDESLYKIIENEKMDEFIRASALNTFAILYFYGIKNKQFLINYSKKLVENRKEDDNSYLYQEIVQIAKDFRLVELNDTIDRIYNLIAEINVEEIEVIEERFKDENFVIDEDEFPIEPYYKYIDDTINIMEKWQCFREKDDEEFYSSNEFFICTSEAEKRDSFILKKVDKLGRNDLCFCGSGKKYKNCCLNKIEDLIEMLDSIDENVCKAEWYKSRDKFVIAIEEYKIAWAFVTIICEENKIKTITEYEKKYDGYNKITNWLQDYIELLEEQNKKAYYNSLIKICDIAERVFDFEDESERYWKELFIRARASGLFKKGKKEEARQILNNYLKTKPEWVWGYMEIADWYLNEMDEKNYNPKEAEKVLLKAEKIDNMNDKDAIYQRLEELYEDLGNDKKADEYNKKWQKYLEEF